MNMYDHIEALEEQLSAAMVRNDLLLEENKRLKEASEIAELQHTADLREIANRDDEIKSLREKYEYVCRLDDYDPDFIDPDNPPVLSDELVQENIELKKEVEELKERIRMREALSNMTKKIDEAGVYDDE